ncbi:MarR family winged helix-turn-helix transcriptional regulator [Sphingomonas bacterium]|uniref:MarR family winged helix-turn-helix transcriptional regulator n=1 Tax=Sphingomonas bacterium TaxID=1895847 RepID=UPI001576B188|nr:MarR family winged helix-turn-helix transcriptional regulator [Sphingomonas bacterium]
MQTPSENRIRDIVARLRAATSDLGQLAEAIDTAPPIMPAGRQRFAEKAALLLRHRQLRKRFLPVDLFQEPGWDMLIAVYIADRKGQPVNVKTLVAMVDAPATTAQRWIDHLDKLGLVSRATDPMDRRRIEVSLTGAGQAAMESYLDAIPEI